MENLKSKKMSAGITLIALVVTIIVLLILAGISIQMLTGDNGILQRAGEAKESSEAEQIKERIKLAYHSALTGGKGSYTKESLEEELENEFGENNYNVDDSGETNWILTAQGQSVKISAGIKEKTLVQKITATNYGDSVDYTITAPDPNNGTYSDWKIFYNDGTNVYIITGDCVPVNKINVAGMTSGMTILTSGDYAVYGQYDQYYHFGADGVDQLVNTANWSNFANGTSAGKKIDGATATGGPTLDMWIASWNAKGYTPLYSKRVTRQKSDTYEANQADYDAYYVGTSENPTTYSALIETRDGNNNPNGGYGDSLYFPHTKQDSSRCVAYWLTSPAARANTNIYDVNISGILYDNYFVEDTFGVRPVVCLPSSILGERDVNGRWVLK